MLQDSCKVTRPIDWEQREAAIAVNHDANLVEEREERKRTLASEIRGKESYTGRANSLVTVKVTFWY